MSFLNPVNEPVLRFSSTDAGAPQINYNARVAGDVKTVLKACLVTGYGDKASAGWSIANEVNHVAEFVSPSVAMSDYRLGIDDTSASSAIWYYQYQNTRVNPAYNSPTKNWTLIDKSHADNGWILLITQRGIVFIEHAYFIASAGLSSRITFLSSIKTGSTALPAQNMAFFNIGHNATIANIFNFYRDGFTHIKLDGNDCILTDALPTDGNQGGTELNKSTFILSSKFYVCASNKKSVLGELPAILVKTANLESELYKVSDQNIADRPVLTVCAGYATAGGDRIAWARNYSLYLDHWEY